MERRVLSIATRGAHAPRACTSVAPAACRPSVMHAAPEAPPPSSLAASLLQAWSSSRTCRCPALRRSRCCARRLCLPSSQPLTTASGGRAAACWEGTCRIRLSSSRTLRRVLPMQPARALAGCACGGQPGGMPGTYCQMWCPIIVCAVQPASTCTSSLLPPLMLLCLAHTFRPCMGRATCPWPRRPCPFTSPG